MPRKPKPTQTPKLRLREDGVWLGDKYDWQPPGFFVLKFTDIVARVAIQHYANLIATRDPDLYRDLTAAVEAAGGWGHRELNDYLCPPDAADAD